MKKSSITLTFGDVAENHVGNQQLGTLANSGFTPEFLASLDIKERVDLGEGAEVYIMRNFVPKHKELFESLNSLTWDAKYFDQRRKKVLNKNARHNLCFAETAQDADYEVGKGTVIAYSTISLLEDLKTLVADLVQDTSLQCEGNLYMDVKKNGIGFHGDAERRRVLGVRLGATHDLVFRWYHKHLPTSERVCITLNSGDAYIMSEKAVGSDWKCSSKRTLRHAAGSATYTNPNAKKVKLVN